MSRPALAWFLLVLAPQAWPGDPGDPGDAGGGEVLEAAPGQWVLPLDAQVDYDPEEALRHGLHDGGLDCTGDGVPDLLFGGEEQGLVRLLSGADLTEVRRHEAELPGPGFGWSVALVGDTNGDGLADYALGHPSAFAGGGRVSLRSGADGALLWQVDRQGEGTDARFAASLARVGDLDGDGRPDLAVGAPGLDSAFVLSGLDGSELLVETDGLGVGHGAVVRGPGDFDLDGTPDLLVGANDLGSDGLGFERRLRVVSGTGSGTLFERTWLKLAGDNLGSWMGAAGDFNLDGFADVVTLEAESFDDNVARVHGGPDGALLDTLGQSGFLTLPAAEYLDAAFVGDVDGDGIGDLAIGLRDQFRAGYEVFSGGSGALLQSLAFGSPQVASHVSVSAAGDLDGDGRAETLLGLHAASNSFNPSEARIVFGGQPWTVGARTRFKAPLDPGQAYAFRTPVTPGTRLKVRVGGAKSVVPVLSLGGAVVDTGKGAKGELTAGVEGFASVVVLNAPDGGPGKVRVAIDVLPPAGKGTLSAPGDGEAPQPLVSGQKAEGSLGPDETSSFFVDAPAGARLDLRLRRSTGSGLVPRLALIGPLSGPGAWLPPASDLLETAEPKLNAKGVTVRKLSVPSAGRYRVDVTGADGSAGGFRLKLRLRRAPGVEKLTAAPAQP